jgi:hypothetical protein
MEKAGQAMKQIHGKLNIDVVDQTMYVFIPPLSQSPRMEIYFDIGLILT